MNQQNINVLAALSFSVLILVMIVVLLAGYILTTPLECTP